MIAGVFHQGSGLGNQLHRYVATRVLALDKGYEWGMMYNPDGSGKPQGFKGKDFMNLDTGHPPGLMWIHNRTQVGTFEEKKILENGVDIRGYDPDINFVQDNTIVDGEFQDERYWAHREKEVDEWLRVCPIYIPDDVCVIGFRGGEYAAFPDLFLTKEYWDKAIAMMKERNPNMRFEVHTDDAALAHQFFPEYKVIQDISINWRSMRYAKQAIIANSSFYILPRWLNGGYTIAPRYWARHNTKVWSLPQNYYSRFLYV